MWCTQQLQLRRESSADCCTSYATPLVCHGRQSTVPRARYACPRRAGGWAARGKAESRSQAAVASSLAAQEYSSTQPQRGQPLRPAPEQAVLPNFWKDSQELGERPQETGLAPLTKTNLDLLLYRAKQLQQQAYSAPSRSERMKAEQAAEGIFKRCLVAAPKDGRAYVSFGKLLTRQRRFGEAEQLYQDGCRMTENINPHIWQAWATLEVRRRNIKRARQLFEASVTADPKHAAAWHGWGMLEKQEGDLMRARELWLTGIQRTQSRPNAHLLQSVAVLAGEMGLTQEARKWFRQATQIIPGNAHGIWQAWAHMEAKQGDASVVRGLLRCGLKASPKSRYIHLAWAQWERLQGSPDTARFLLKRGCALNPTDPALSVAWGCLEEDAGHLDDAQAHFQRAVEGDAYHVPAWQAYGCMEFRRGNMDKARELFQNGVWADPSSKGVTAVWQAWGMLEAQEGNLELARQMLKCSVKADPTSQQSWQSWAALEEGVGNMERGKELRDLGIQSVQRIWWPRNFAAGFAMPPAVSGDAEEPPIASIKRTVAQWFSSFGVPTTAAPESGADLREAELEEDMKRWGSSDSSELAQVSDAS